MKKIILLLVFLLPLVQGCAELKHYSQKPKNIYEQNAVNDLLSCLNELQDIGPEEFGTSFEVAEEGLQHGRNEDTLHFICLSLSPKADYQQFKQGMETFEQYIAEQPDSPGDIQGLKILVDRLDEEIVNKWRAWKSLLEDKKELMAEVESLEGKLEQDQILIEELQLQIEQLKNIENIIKGREAGQP